MQQQLQEILDIPDIIGAMVFDSGGKMISESFHDLSDKQRSIQNDWGKLFQILEGIIEADVLFEKKRIYFRNAGKRIIVVLMESHAPAAMVRLSCDAILSAIGTDTKTKNKAGKWFRKKFK